MVSVELTAGDEILILACDGLWDVADMDTAGGLARTHSKSKGLKAAAQVAHPRALSFLLDVGACFLCGGVSGGDAGAF